MRIGFDVSPLHRPHPPGVVRATRGLVEELERRGVLEIVRLAPPDPGPDPGDVSIDRRSDPAPRPSRVSSIAWRQRVLPLEVERRGLVGIHSPVSAFAWFGAGARVQTVHELPWRHGGDENDDLRHRFWVRFGARRAARIVVPSDFVARDLAQACPASAPRIRCIPWGVDDVFRARRNPGATSTWGDFVLAPGAARAKKNAAAILRALARMSVDERPKLVITGACDDRDERALRDRARECGVLDALVLSGSITDDALAAAYSDARAVLVLSASEGFAFPVLEAMSAGTPVIVAARTAQAELAGDAGIAVDPLDPLAVANSIRRVLRDRRASRERSIVRAAEFTWRRAAERVEALWSEIAR